MTDHEAMGLGPGGVELFARAAELYAEAGDPGEALAARARGAYVLALSGRSDEALAAVSEPYERVLALFAEGGTGVRQAASVLVGRARILSQRVHEAAETNGPSGGKALAAAQTAARELLALAGPDTGDDLLVAARAAEAQAMLGELAAHAGDPERAVELLSRASEAFVAAGLPWFAVEYEARLTGIAGHLGDVETAERAARGALEHGAPCMEATGRARLHLQLAEVLGATGRFGPAADHALEASHWADEGGEGATLGAWARHQLGGFLLRQARWAEAAEVLESVLPELSAQTHGDGALVQTQWWLGDCLTELGEHREAAEHWLRAAEIARHWPEQRDHAMLAHLAAEALGHAGLLPQAEQAYARAGDLWRSLGNVHGLIRSLRARAWLAVRDAGTGLDAARELMGKAVRACEDAVPEDHEAHVELVGELAQTHRQFGDLVARSVPEDADDEAIRALFEEALAHVTLAVAGFLSLGGDALHSRTGAQLAAGWLEADLEHSDWAAARARASALGVRRGRPRGRDGGGPAGRGGALVAGGGGVGAPLGCARALSAGRSHAAASRVPCLRAVRGWARSSPRPMGRCPSPVQRRRETRLGAQASTPRRSAAAPPGVRRGTRPCRPRGTTRGPGLRGGPRWCRGRRRRGPG